MLPSGLQRRRPLGSPILYKTSPQGGLACNPYNLCVFLLILLADYDLSLPPPPSTDDCRSAGLSATGSRVRQEPPEPAALRLASMMSLLPGVHGSGISEGSGSGAMGAVVAVVDPARAEVGLV